MATFDPDTGNLVLQLVYDGLPHSGKTATVNSLGSLLGRQVITPEEREGRTLYFDWLDYQGGVCMGRPIQCRVVTVPGQPELIGRRSKLLKMADVIIFVVDSTQEGFEGTPELLADLIQQLARDNRKVPVLLQLNKRDQANVLSEEKVLGILGEDLFRRCIQTVATAGVGVRETFVFAISHALQDLKDSGTLYGDRVGGLNENQIHPRDPDQMMEILFERTTQPIALKTMEKILATDK